MDERESAPAAEPLPVGRQVDGGWAKLMPDVDRRRAWLLTVDGAPQSYVDLDEPEHLEFEYARRLGHVADVLPRGPLDVLHLGGGALTLPRYLAASRPGSRQTVVEADGPLVDLVDEVLPLTAASGSPCTGTMRGTTWTVRSPARPISSWGTSSEAPGYRRR